ncbi:diguanylate cyclase (GGDEF)-like protein [Oxalobacteraceae bacterium GrIS 2.11]
MKNKIFNYLIQIASPGFIPDSLAILLSYLTILAIFPIDVVTGSKISLNFIYVFPLTLVALHCSRNFAVLGALALSLTVQVLTLITFSEDSWSSRLFLFGLIFISDSILVLVARFARFNILEAKRLSTTDPLTRLSNRRALEEAISLETTRQKRYGGQFSLMLIDLDGFKAVNDTMGHLAGDKALVLLADILREHTRQSDLAFRIGGDEFVVLMPNTEVADCEKICTGLSKLIAEKMSAVSFPITASIGYTTIDRAPTIAVDILTIADKAMYEAKSAGKNRIVRGYDQSAIAA